MDRLRSIVEDKQKLKDPYWANLYQTDIRNLFPKYELAKIQKAKAKYDKFRLMMENIQDFLFIEKHRKETQKSTHQIDGILEQIEALQETQPQVYQTDIIRQRDNAELITQELVKYGSEIKNKQSHKNNKLDLVLKDNQKWKQYFEIHSKQTEALPKEEMLVEKIHVSETVTIPNSCQNLNQSTSSLILMERLKQMQIRKGLLQKWQKPAQEVHVPKQFLSDWKQQTENIDFQQYV